MRPELKRAQQIAQEYQPKPAQQTILPKQSLQGNTRPEYKTD